MAKAIKVWTADDLLANAVEVGDCQEWLGYYTTGTRVPYVYHCGKMMSARKLMAVLNGRDVDGIKYWGVNCANWRCINPEHIVGRNRGQHMAYMASLVNHAGVQRVAKLQEVARARVGKLTELEVASIRLDDRRLADVAADHGISRSLVSKIRTGGAWRQVSASVTPWGGLMR